MDGAIEQTKPKVKGKRMTPLEQFTDIKDWIKKIFDEITCLHAGIADLNTKLENLKDKVNDQQHELDKRLTVVENFIEHRAKLEWLLIGAIIAQAVLIIKDIFFP